MRFMRGAGHYSWIAFCNLLVLIALLLAIEAVARAYAVAFKGKSFFRTPHDSPWIIAYDSPRPTLHPAGGIFHHESRIIPQRKAPDEFRIIAVGGSTTLGLDPYRLAGVHYPKVLERALNGTSSGRRYVVLNAGGEAYSSMHVLVNIVTRLLEFEPDLIIVMEAINDYTVNYFGGGALPDYSNKYLQPYFVHPQFQVTSSVYGTLSQSRLLSAVGLPQYLANAHGRLDRRNSVEPGAPYFLRNLRSIKAVLQEYDIKLLMLSQPHRLGETDKQNADATYYARITSEFARTNGIPFVDLFNEFGHDGQFFVDEIHHTPAGIDRLVRLILPEVSRIAHESEHPAALASRATTNANGSRAVAAAR
jgi:lysophospholipase L1-like esterase